MIVIDDFLNPEMWNVFSNPANWQEPLGSTWLDKDAQPSNMWEELSHIVWKATLPNIEFIGYEYWTNILGDNLDETKPSINMLGWHRDQDEALYNETGKEELPIMGVVLYGHKDTPLGGYLEIDRHREVERIQPRPNRLVVFDVYNWHRVSPVAYGNRYTFSCNIWANKIKGVVNE